MPARLSLFAPWFAIVLLTAGTALAGTCPGVATGGADVETIRALEQKGAETNVKGQSLADAQNFFGPEFMTIRPDGTLISRSGILRAYLNGKLKPWAARFDLTNLDIKVYCDAAVVAGLAVAEPLGARPGMHPLHFRYLDVWVRLPAGWRLGATQFAKF